MAPDIHHLWPFKTYSFYRKVKEVKRHGAPTPSLQMDALILVASDDATAGSVIAKHDLAGVKVKDRTATYLIFPSSRGASHCCFCFAVPKRDNISMFPVSGALQLKISEANKDLP